MSAPVSDTVIEAFAAAVRGRLMQREEAAVPGLGTFSVTHEVSRVVVSEDGTRTLRPPRDTVRFEADPSRSEGPPA